MKLSIRKGAKRYWLTDDHRSSREAGQRITFGDTSSAERFLAFALQKWDAMRLLRGLWKERFSGDPGRLKDHQVVAGIAKAMSSGFVRVSERPMPNWSGRKASKSTPPADEPAPAPVPPPQENEENVFKLAEVIEVVHRPGEGCVAGAAPVSTSGTFPQLVERSDKQGGAFKQYINLDKEIEGVSKTHPEYGRAIELRARVEWVSGDKSKSLAGKKVHWTYEVTPHSGGKRPASLNGTQKEGFSSAGGKKTLVASTNSKGWTPIVKFHVSAYAGDEFTVHAQADVDENGTPSGDKAPAGPYVVWRKFWYQATHAKGKTVDLPDKSVAAYGQLAAEMIEAEKVTYQKSEIANGDRTFYPNWMVEDGGNDDEDVVIGGHNRDWFYKKLNKESHRPVKGHLIICDHQWDPAGDSTDLHSGPMEARTKEVTFNLGAWNTGILKPALSGNLVAFGKWRAGRGNVFREFFQSIGVALKVTDPIKREGDLTDDNIKVEKGRTALNAVTVELPADCPDPGKYPITIHLRLSYGTYWAGESKKDQMLIVYQKGAPKAFNQVVAHEFGHGFAQVPRPGSQPPGLVNHPTQYTNEHGGQGSHCNTSATLTIDPNYPAGLYQGGTCIMFHQVNPTGCTQTFCADCEPYLRLEKMDKMQ